MEKFRLFIVMLQVLYVSATKSLSVRFSSQYNVWLLVRCWSKVLREIENQSTLEQLRSKALHIAAPERIRYRRPSKLLD